MVHLLDSEIFCEILFLVFDNYKKFENSGKPILINVNKALLLIFTQSKVKKNAYFFVLILKVIASNWVGFERRSKPIKNGKQII